MGEYRLAVLVPSRGRPASVQRLWRAIQDTAARPDQVDLLVRVDDDDTSAARYFNIEGPYLTKGPRIKLAASWNELADLASLGGWTHLALWGDDNIPMTQGWDAKFVDILAERGPGFVYGRDGVWDHTYDKDVPGHLVLPTATVWPIELHRALGWVSPPGLTHLCIDLAWRDLGIAADCLYFADDVFIRHFHRIAGAPDDATYREANDDRVQYASDQNGFSLWRNGPQFQAALGRVRAAREEWFGGSV
jgi:hypothetical protein